MVSACRIKMQISTVFDFDNAKLVWRAARVVVSTLKTMCLGVVQQWHGSFTRSRLISRGTGSTGQALNLWRGAKSGVLFLYWRMSSANANGEYLNRDTITNVLSTVVD